MKNFINNYLKIYRPQKVGKFRALLAIVFLLGFGLSVDAQDEKFNFSLQDVTIEYVLDEIRTKSEVNFVYNHEELQNAPKISLSLKEATLKEVLDAALKGTGLTFQEIKGTIVIKPVVNDLKMGQNNEGLKTTQTVRGQVLDRSSKSSLPFATIMLVDSDPIIGATTDLDGYFEMQNVPFGRHSFKASFMGYGDVIVPEILVGSAKEVVLNVEMKEQIQELGEIVVRSANREPMNEMAIVSAKSFNAEETKRFAASISDPARMAQSFAGVAGGDDASNEIIIRGNSPNWLLWRLEGVEIPSPNHFAEEGYASGAVSILSSNMLGSSDFYTGAFPGEFGNALSGVFDISLRNGNNLAYEHTFQAGVLGFDFASEGPFKKGYGGSYLFNFRYSTLSLLNDMNVQISENALPRYQDLSFKVNLPTKKAGTFSIWGVGGTSQSDEKFLPDTTQTEDIEHGYSDFTKSGMYASGITHTAYVNPNTYFRSVLSVSSSWSSEDYETMDSLGVLRGEFYDDLQNSAIRFNSYMNTKVSSKLSIRTGVVYSNLNYNYYSRNRVDSTNEWSTFLNSNGRTSLYQGYGQFAYNFSDRVKVIGGVHGTYFALNDDVSIEPRLAFNWQLNDTQKLSFGYGLHSRHENLPVYFMEITDENGNTHSPNKSLELTRSNHFVLGYEKMVTDHLSVKAEVYYQHMGNLPVPNNPDKHLAPMFGGVNQDDTLANIGKGRNYGLELTVQKYFTDGYYFLVTSSLFDAKYKTADGHWYNTKYNLNYVNNFVGGKEVKWGANRLLGFNTKVIWTGGKRIFPIDLAASIEEGDAVYDEDVDIWSVQAKDYFRVDLGFSLRFYRPRSEQVISLDIQNATNRLNTWAEIYDATNEQVIDYPMAGLIPILSYRIEF